MKLNRKKCVHIRMNGVGTVRFVDGSELEQTVDATYLGTKITADAKGDREINKRIGECGGIMKNLDPVRENTTAGVKARIQVFMMVVKAKLVYGLEACRLMESSCTQIDAFQIRGPMNILWLKHVYYDRKHEPKDIRSGRGSNGETSGQNHRLDESTNRGCMASPDQSRRGGCYENSHLCQHGMGTRTRTKA